MKSIKEYCEDIADLIVFKENITLRMWENILDYKKCYELKEEISILK